MATVNSLICFGGLNGKTVTFTDAGDVVNLTNHGVRPGLACFFQNTGGAPPVGLSTNTLYYAKQGADANKFLLYPTKADAIAGTNQVTFSGTGSGTTKVKSSLIFTGADLSRYDNARIYDGLASWNNGRSGASPYDVEVCEIGESFSDILTAVFEVTVPSAQNIITTKVNGIRSAAFHAGIFPATTLDTLTSTAGYVLYNSAVTTGSLFKMTRYRDTLDGIILLNKANASITATDLGVQCRLYNCQIIGAASSVVGVGTNLRSALGEAVNNLFWGFATGATFGSSQLGLYFVNNTLTKNTAALSAASTVRGFFYNNISVGNTTNWPTQPSNLEGASNNAGLSGEAWLTGSGTRITMATSHFANFTNNDFKAAAANPPQVETGIAPYGAPLEDIAGHVRPDYITGSGTTPVTAGSFVTGVVYSITTVGTTDFTAIGASANTVGVEFRATGAGSGTGTATPQAKIDVGCFEYDHLAGPWPNLRTVQVAVKDKSTGLPVQYAHVYLCKVSDKSQVLNGATDASGVVSAEVTYSSDIPLMGWARQMDLSGTDYTPEDIAGTFTSNGFSVTVSLTPI